MQCIYHVHWDVGAHAAFSRTFVLSSNLGSTNNVRDRNSCLSLRKLFCLFRQSFSQWTEQFCSVDRVHWKACLLFLSFSDWSCRPLYYRQSGDEWAVLSGINCWLTPKVEGRLSRYETCKNLLNTCVHAQVHTVLRFFQCCPKNHIAQYYPRKDYTMAAPKSDWCYL